MTKASRVTSILTFVLLVCASSGYAIGRQVAPRDHFPVFNNPKMLTVAEVKKLNLLHPNDAVIGVSRGSEAKAYPVAIMGIHELGNDVIDGEPIAVGW